MIYNDYDEHKPTPLIFISTDSPTVNNSEISVPLYRRKTNLTECVCRWKKAGLAF